MEEFNALFERGTAQLGEIVFLDGREWKKPGFLARRKLRASISDLEAALRIYPESWQSLVFIGKAFQALGEEEQCLDHFLRAAALEPTNRSIAKEAGAAAGRLGKHDLAAQVMRESASLHPGDGALHTNLGLAYLLSGQADLAKVEFKIVVAAEPDNPVAKRLVEVAAGVVSQEIECPKSQGEVAALL